MKEVSQEAKNVESTVSRQQIVVFKLGKEDYGIAIDQIKEVVITPTVTRMPRTPSFMKGVANIRGNIIAILDLEEKLGLVADNDKDEAGKNFTLVVESDEFKMGILSREVPNTLSVSSSQIESYQFTSDQAEQSYVKGIVKLEDRLVILIDAFNVIGEKDKQLLVEKSSQVA